MEGDVSYTLRYYPYNIDELGVGDPRWNGSTPLIGAIMSWQPSIVQYLVDQGADVHAMEGDARRAGFSAMTTFRLSASASVPQRNRPPSRVERLAPDRAPPGARRGRVLL